MKPAPLVRFPLTLMITAVLAIGACSLGPRSAMAANAAAQQATDVGSGQSASATWAHFFALASKRSDSLAGSPDRLAARSEAEKQAQSWWPAPPSLSVDELNDRWGTDRGRVEQSLTVAVPLWLPGQRAAEIHLAQSAKGSEMEQSELRRWELAGVLRERWWQLAHARANVRFARRSAGHAQTLAKDAQRRLQAGELSRVAANQLQSAYLAAEDARLEVEATLDEHERSFELLTGVRAPERLLSESADHAAALRAQPENRGSHTHAARKLDLAEDQGLLSRHPMLRAAKASAYHAEAAVARARLHRREAPQLELSAVRERPEQGMPRDRAVVLRLNLPLSSTSAWRAEVLTASADAQEADVRLAQLRKELAHHAELSWRQWLDADKRKAIAKAQRALARENVEWAKTAFELGEIDLADWLDAQQQSLAAEQHYALQRIAARAALSRVNQALGVIP